MSNNKQSEPANEKNSSFMRIAFVTAIAGFTEILFNHPLWALKSRKQCNYPFTLNPFVLYKGVAYHAASEIVFSPMQIGMAIKLSEHFYQYFPKDTAPFGTLLGATLAGSATGIISTPIDVIMVQQQKIAKIDSNKIINDFRDIGAKIKSEYGYKIFFCGASMAACKVAISNNGIFLATPYLTNKINYYFGDSSIGTHFMSGIVSGFISAIITQPIDTISRLQQDQALNPIRLNAFEHSKMLYKSYGHKGFFRGLAWRSAQIVTSTAIIGTAVGVSGPRP